MTTAPVQQALSFDACDFDTEDPRTIQERFERFHQTHPEVMDYLLKLVAQVRERGLRRCGIRVLWERLRWHFFIERDPEEDFKLNDHYHSRYARLIVKEHPELAEFFELRRLRSN